MLHPSGSHIHTPAQSTTTQQKTQFFGLINYLLNAALSYRKMGNIFHPKPPSNTLTHTHTTSSSPNDCGLSKQANFWWGHVPHKNTSLCLPLCYLLMVKVASLTLSRGGDICLTDHPGNCGLNSTVDLSLVSVPWVQRPSSPTEANQCMCDDHGQSQIGFIIFPKED